jgi:two-component system chemotaxis response regulator CheY
LQAQKTVQNLLIVDDSPVSRKILRSCLPRERTFSITEAGDGAAALQRFRESPPDVTFLDLTMPRMDGLECLAELRALAPQAVVVVVTADVQERSLARARELGAADVLEKPPSREAVAAVLQRIEDRARGADAA